MKKVISTVCVVATSVLVIYSCSPKTNKNTPPPPPPNPPPASMSTQEQTDVAKKPEALNMLTDKEKSEGWKLLFDGNSTEGWHTYGSKSIGTAWKVDKGAIYFDASNDGTSKSGGDIVSDKEYGNFELQIDWKIDKNGNSGICIYSHEDKAKYDWMWATAPEIQIVDNEGHPDGKIFKHQAGDLYDLIPAKTHAEHPPLEWNTYLIRCVNGKLDVHLNGVHILDTQLWNDNWRTLIANSKFKNAADFGTYKMGRIGLQDHGNNVWFRNIKIREL